GQIGFPIEGIQAAGQPQRTLTDPTKCIEIMTGAPLPEGTDSVIPYESIDVKDKIAKLSDPIEKNQNVHHQGSDAKQNEILLSRGFKISPAEVAMLASVGKSEVNVIKYPSSAVISTGDELVDVDQSPLPHQIRKSNSYMLSAALNELGCKADLFHLIDNEKEIKEKLEAILNKYDLIILSGGVSKGKFDFIPQVLESLQVKKLFHQVSQRPGKPMWFGQSQKNTVFGLPGNPVSTFACFLRYVKLWLTNSFGNQAQKQSAILAEDYSFSPKLTYFLQVKIQNENGKLMAYPFSGGGSGDFANLKVVDGFLELPLHQSKFQKGESFPLITFR
ncbi:MAG TPA: molybdopterin molybdotransferase MoeA, partial [Cyclobacteriaceae bacterium]|nr:molybdopterin molybdotransferase MoeA [Cyclobacteriaceae bacterium]